jgi:hypothetical protein
VDFPWLDRTRSRSGGAAARLAASQRELRDRAGVYFRLGFTADAAAARLAAAIAWEFDPPYGAHKRPAALSDAAIAAAVRETFARRPSGVL